MDKQRAPAVSLSSCLFLAAMIGISSPSGVFGAASMESYISEVDGSQQPYGLYLPEPFDPDVPHPVVFFAHGRMERANDDFYDTYRHQASFADEHGWILVNLDGRGDTQYEGIGENDFFEVLDKVRHTYLIDESRLYLTGCSMGGNGAWKIGLRYPDLFAAVAGTDGTCDIGFFTWVGFGSFQEPLLRSALPLDIAENGKHLNFYMMVDTNDNFVPPDTNGRRLHERLNELGYEHVYIENAGSHCSGYDSLGIYQFFSQRLNDPSPKNVFLKANQLKYGSAYWVRMDRMEKTMVFATMEATIDAKARVFVTASGLLQYTLVLTPQLVGSDEVSVLAGGEEVYTGPTQEITVSAMLDESGNSIGWSADDALPRGLRKTAKIEGPIGHAFTSKFLLVMGTMTKADIPRNREEAERFAFEWNGWMHANVSPVEDTSITEDDIATSNLTLFGTADSNSIIAAINDLLPVRIWNNRIVVGANEYEGNDYGLYMVFPNPLNPDRYVVISHGKIEGSGPTNLEGLSWGWPDYVVFDRTTVTGGYLPTAWVEHGFFDQYWRLDNDEDGMDDIFEKEIIDADPDDAIAGIEDVNPADDFDGDGQDNRTEYNAGTSPTDAGSFFCVLSVGPDPTDPGNFNFSWKIAAGRSYYIQWADSADGPWHEIAELDPADISDEGEMRTWTDRGTDPAMGGIKPGDCPARFYKLAAYR